MNSRTHNDQRGVTLVEVVVVGVLASVVMLALTGFYINSQATWIDASAQAVTQREVTFVAETIADSVHASYNAIVSTSPTTLILYDAPIGTGPAQEKCRFRLDPVDSLIHQWHLTTDGGPLSYSRVTRFDVTTDGAMVKVLALEMRPSSGRLISESLNAAMYNRP
jgi:Tfp pilus assembly protein PilE